MGTGVEARTEQDDLTHSRRGAASRHVVDETGARNGGGPRAGRASVGVARQQPVNGRNPCGLQQHAIGRRDEGFRERVVEQARTPALEVLETAEECDVLRGATRRHGLRSIDSPMTHVNRRHRRMRSSSPRPTILSLRISSLWANLQH